MKWFPSSGHCLFEITADVGRNGAKRMAPSPITLKLHSKAHLPAEDTAPGRAFLITARRFC
jgi:hypothetical protein